MIRSENYFIDGEQREQILGMTKVLVLLFVVFVDLSQADKQVIRIISARRAIPAEKGIHEEQFD